MTTSPADGLATRALRRDEIPAAVDLLARGMRDNPVHVAALGADPARREALLRRLFAILIAQMPHPPLGAFAGEALVGVMGLAPPGRCRPTMAQRMATGPRLLVALGPAAPRVMLWVEEWAHHDADRPHWHVGPMAVVPERRGGGVGSRLLADVTDRADADGVAVALVTDTEESARLFARHGFRREREFATLRVPTVLLVRPAAGAAR